jgi:hypothetical protein
MAGTGNPAAGRERPWHSAYQDVVSAPLLRFIELEAAASVTRNFQPLLVPGLLQTEEYAREVLGQLAADLPGHRLDSLVEVRMRRQELLTRDDSPLLFFILDEAATRRIVGGRDVTRRQLLRLTQAAATPRITVEVVPYSAGCHAGLSGSFVIQEFPDGADADVLFQEGPREDELRGDDPELISRYRAVFEDLRRLSLGPEGSLAFLNALANSLA